MGNAEQEDEQEDLLLLLLLTFIGAVTMMLVEIRMLSALACMHRDCLYTTTAHNDGQHVVLYT